MIPLSSVSAALLAFGAVLTSVSAVAGSITAGIGLLFELFVFALAGTAPSDPVDQVR